MKNKKLLVLGAYGMLGHKLFQQLSGKYDVHATCRSLCSKWSNLLPEKKMMPGVDANDPEKLTCAIEAVRPDIVINCIGIVKQLEAAKDPIPSITINALFPHQLALLCNSFGARLIHISTDCVFSGETGMYTEDDFPDCNDLYGRTKLLGEVDYPHAVTLRTSIIGHELDGNLSLVDWFMSQEKKVQGYTQAIYTGFPTVELARIIAEVVIPNPELQGVYHVSSEPISKYELLRLIADEYGKVIDIEPYDKFHCDRSLDSSRFRDETGYVPPQWPELVAMMHADSLSP